MGDMIFLSKMYHPNIYPDGKVCISILHPPEIDEFNEQESLDEKWRPVLGVQEVVMSVLSILTAPNINSPANVEASVNYQNDYNGYKKKVRQLVRETVENM